MLTPAISGVIYPFFLKTVIAADDEQFDSFTVGLCFLFLFLSRSEKILFLYRALLCSEY